MSGFVGQELLYDYVTSHLDPERTQAVEEYVKSSRDAQADIQRINDGLNYVEHLSDITVSDALLENFKTPSSYLQVLLRKLRFDDWSPGIKMGLEVMVVAVGVISLTLVIPWHKLMDVSWSGKKDIVLSEVQKTKMTAQDVEVSGSPEETTVVFPDEADKSTKKPSAAKEQTPPQKPAPSVPVVAAVTPAPVPDKPKATAKAVKEEASGEKHQGYLFRGLIRATNVSAVTPKFVEKITELGGRKAGEVELGWKKGNSSYFHFTIPESKQQALVDFAKDYGGLTLSKEKHDRVLPEGIVRVIFSIEEKK